MNQLLRSAPYFPVADVERTATHYERVFGFQREYIAGSPAQFAIMTRDGLSVMLRLVPDANRISPNEHQGGTWDAFFWVRDVRALHTELGVDPISWTLVRQLVIGTRTRSGCSSQASNAAAADCTIPG